MRERERERGGEEDFSLQREHAWDNVSKGPFSGLIQFFLRGAMNPIGSPQNRRITIAVSSKRTEPGKL